MFIGHFGIGFGAKKIAPAVSLAWLFIAAQFVDLLWPTLLLLDIEHVVISPGITKATPLDFVDYPITHSLLMVAGWGVLLGLITWFIFKRVNYSILIFLLVVSHWVLDLIVHRPDLPLTPNGDHYVGFGLWNFPVLTLIIEFSIFIAGLFLYLKSTRAMNGFGKYGLLFLVILFISIQLINAFGPPPENVPALAWGAQLQWVLIILAFFVDRKRTSV